MKSKIPFLVACVFVAVAVAGQAWSSERGSRLDQFKKFLREHPDLSPEEAIKQFPGSGRTQEPEADTGLITEDKFFRSTHTMAIPSSAKTLRILLVSKANIELAPISGTTAFVTVESASSKSQEAAENLVRALTFTGRDQTVVLSHDLNEFKCTRVQLGSQLSVAGSCYLRVIVHLPEGFDLQVTDNRERINQVNRPFSSQDIIDAVAGEFSLSRVTALQKQLSAHPSARFSGQEVLAIVNMVSTFDVDDAIELLENHIGKISANEIDAILTKAFAIDRLKIFEVLISKWGSPSEREMLIQVIDRNFSSFEREKALRAMVILSPRN